MVSTNKPIWVLASLLFALWGCDQPQNGAQPRLQIEFAGLSAQECVPPNRSTLRPQVTRLIIQRQDDMNGWQTVADEDGPFDASRQVTIPKTPSSPLSMRAIACVGTEARWIAHHSGQLEEDMKFKLPLTFRPVGKMSCLGPRALSDGTVSDAFNEPRAFAAAQFADRDSTLYLLSGGALRHDPATNSFVGLAPGEAWSIFDISEALIFPGSTRAVAYRSRPMLESRLGAAAVPIQIESRTGVLVIGGADAEANPGQNRISMGSSSTGILGRREFCRRMSRRCSKR